MPYFTLLAYPILPCTLIYLDPLLPPYLTSLNFTLHLFNINLLYFLSYCTYKPYFMYPNYFILPSVTSLAK